MKKNDCITLNIEDITNLGFGVGRHEGAVVFVASTVPGDVAEVKIIKEASSYYVGRVERFIKLSAIRAEGRCDSKKCHSCAYTGICYEEELKIKTGTVSSAFKKAGLSDIKILPTVGSPSLTAYRNKAQYPVCRDKDGNYTIGFYAPKSHKVCEAADCPIAPDVFAKILNTLREFFKKHDFSTYDESSGKGLIRHIYLRRGEVGGEILLTLVITEDTLPFSDELCEIISKSFPEVVGILLNKNSKQTNVILGEKYTLLYGRDYIMDTLAGVKLKLTAPSFYQVNHGATELLYAKARELAALTKHDTLLDLYCGVGSIGLSMAADAHELFGIEIVDSAVECATYNATINGITNAKFYSGDATDSEKLLDIAEREESRKILPDVIVLDPPRGGCDEKLLTFISSLSPKRIVYISCNPATLARDVSILRNCGFDANEVTPFDLFPGTGHVESVVCLKRQIQQ